LLLEIWKSEKRKKKKNEYIYNSDHYSVMLQHLTNKPTIAHDTLVGLYLNQVESSIEY